MSNYSVFAQYYDILTQNAEFKVRSDYISDFFNSYKINGNKVLDVACGTGTLSYYLKQKGFDITGIDNSEEMLSVASAKLGASLIKCDMRSFDFNESFDACICTLDSINHLEIESDWKKCFESVYKSLKSGGLFIFDVNTVYKHNEVLSGNTFVFDEDEFFLSWDNEFVDNGKVRIILDFFIKEGESYKRFTEDFIETAFETDDIVRMLSSHFDVLAVYDDLTFKAPKEDSERLYFICKRK